MWNGFRSAEFRPSKWLDAVLADLCTVRWCDAYFCGLRRDWSVGYLAGLRLEQPFPVLIDNVRGARK